MWVDLILYAIAANQVEAWTSPAFSNTTYGLLKDLRNEITFVPFTTEQKVQTAKSIENVFQVYVHRFLKIDDYGKEYPNIDPVPRSQAISEEAATLSDKDFHYKYVDLFLSLRDKHTVYLLRKTFTAIIFAQLESDDMIKNPLPIVAGFSSRQPVLDASQDAKKAQVGDKLISIDGISFKEYAEKVKYTIGGANTPALYRNALNSLSGINFAIQKVKQENEVKYVLERPDGTRYEVVLPWVALKDLNCVADAKKFIANPSFTPEKEVGVQTIKNHPNLLIERPAVLDLPETMDAKAGAEDDTQANIVYNPTIESLISWGIYKKDTLNMGVIKLGTFKTNAGIEETIKLIRTIVGDYLAETKSIVFDIRSNGGGYAIIAQALNQLFVADAVSAKHRALVTDVNLRFMPTQGQQWADAAKKVQPGDKYTASIDKYSKESINAYGQAYLKPVGILNDGFCYSACDSFSAAMQDNDAALIFGEDLQTGAGGANVLDYDNVVTAANSADFPPLPFKGKMLNPMGMTLSFGQGIRVGKYNEQLIENYGVAADVVVRPSLDDIKKQSSDSQFDRIAAKLSEYGAQRQKNDLFFKSNFDYELKAFANEPIKFSVQSTGLKKISVTDLIAPSDKTQVSIADVKARQTSTFNIEHTLAPGNYPFGFTAVNGIRIANPLTLVNTKLYTYNLGISLANPEVNAWVKKDNGYQIGGDSYNGEINSNLEFSLAPAKTVTLEVDAIYDSYPGYDFFSIRYYDDKGANDLLKPVAGVGKVATKYTFKPVGNFQVSFQFTSLGGGRIVRLNSVSLTGESAVAPVSSTTTATTVATTATSATTPSSTSVVVTGTGIVTSSTGVVNTKTTTIVATSTPSTQTSSASASVAPTTTVANSVSVKPTATRVITTVEPSIETSVPSKTSASTKPDSTVQPYLPAIESPKPYGEYDDSKGSKDYNTTSGAMKIAGSVLAYVLLVALI
ncbi:hypothetical protein HDV02_005590 [Globomyces sp. JEL0801]|nr:hypothetical protein HDV02_005590 [Globomyces sp. JEL0801]